VARFYGILLIVLLVIVSGFIAYVGDIVGRRMGRKRLSLFGMRPRHTAIAFSVVAGMLITIFTLATAMAVSKNVHDGFLRVDEMRRAQADLSRRTRELTALAKDLERRRAEAEAQVRQRKAELDRTRKSLASTQEEVKRQESLLGEAQRQLAATSKELKDQQQELTNASLAFSRESLRYDALSKARNALESDVARTTREIAIRRANPVLFRVEQPLAVKLITGGQAVASVRGGLDAFVSELDRQLRAAGAAPAAGTDAAVVIRHLVVDQESKSVAVATREQVLDAIAREISRAQGGVIVRAYSLYNTVEGEPVYIDFELFANQQVYSRGQVLAETVVDGRLSEAGIYAALESLLKDDVGSKARKDGVMPRVSPPGSEASGGSPGAVGEMSRRDLFADVGTLRGINGPAKITAVAANDTWTIGPLAVEFRIEPVA
jgi:uncharacterized protein (DUF3084 family)